MSHSPQGTTLHVILVSGISPHYLWQLESSFNELPFGHSAKVVNLGHDGHPPKLLGTVVINGESQTAVGREPRPYDEDTAVKLEALG